MNLIMGFLHLLNAFTVQIIQTGGYFGIFFAMALESLMVPIPSEVILPFGGYLASSGSLSVFGVVLAGTIGGTVGSLGLYYLATFLGNAFVKKWGKYIFVSEEHIKITSEWFRKYGNFAIFTTRVLPIVRGIISIPAGIARMNVLAFTVYTFLGTFVWSLILTYFGFQLGLSNMSTHLIWIVTIVIAGLAIAIYFLSHVARKHSEFFGVLINVSLWLVLIFFISYSLYESYAPIKTSDLNYLNVVKIQKEMSENDFSFYVVGDTFQNPESLRKIPAFQDSAKKSFIVSLGNMVYSGDKAKYRILLHEIKKVKVPFVAIPGPLDLSDQGYQNYYNIFGDYDYAFDIKGVRFIMLNDANGRISSEQFNWLTNELSEIPSSSTVIVTLSVPPSWVNSNDTLDEKTSNKLRNILNSHPTLLFSMGKNATILSTPIKSAITDENDYLRVQINGKGPSIKIEKVRMKKGDTLMEEISVYLYSVWVLEWPVLGIIGMAILITWFFFKHYKVFVKIEKRK
ncbi:VTT domain-containing protein [Mesoaciditoga lauensis]|uniref:VTT domain-containing protein n=1 Tax=Mesoaciditoga lauensis TaxID=1495039 RepID=UPI00068F3C99|nr:VTT domain-containing protein [Mesoaciditoga lauensis]